MLHLAHRYFLYARTRLGYYHHLRRLRNRSTRLHSIVEPVQIRGTGNIINFMKMYKSIKLPGLVADVTIYPLAILEDNYSYLIVDTNNVAVVVDPADPMVVEVREREVSTVYRILYNVTECSEGTRATSQGYTNNPQTLVSSTWLSSLWCLLHIMEVNEMFTYSCVVLLKVVYIHCY